jgi:hypothetical protein
MFHVDAPSLDAQQMQGTLYATPATLSAAPVANPAARIDSASADEAWCLSVVTRAASIAGNDRLNRLIGAPSSSGIAIALRFTTLLSGGSSHYQEAMPENGACGAVSLCILTPRGTVVARSLSEQRQSCKGRARQ